MAKRKLLRKIIIAALFEVFFVSVSYAMNINDFWKNIESADARLSEQPYSPQYLIDFYKESSRDELVATFNINEFIIEELDCDNVYALASVISGDTLSNDEFRYFRAWLVTLGKDVVNTAINKPELLLKDVDIKKYLFNKEVEYDDFNFYLDDVFTEKFGISIYEVLGDYSASGKKSHNPMSMEEIKSRFSLLFKLASETK